MLKVYFHNKNTVRKAPFLPPSGQVLSSCFCRPSAEYLFIASAPRCQIFMRHYSPRYLQQQLGTGLQMWKRFAALAASCARRTCTVSSCFTSQSSSGCSLMTNTHMSRGFDIMPGREFERGDVVLAAHYCFSSCTTSTFKIRAVICRRPHPPMVKS